VKKLIEMIEAKAKQVDFYGVVSIFKKNQEIFNKAYGFRDKNNRIHNNVDTKFSIASGTKLFTALGIGTLIDQNKIALDTEIHDVFKEPMSFIDKKATILHLLTHTSGIYDYYDEDVVTDFDNSYLEIPWYKLETPTDYLPLFINRNMKFRPGQGISYSNGGYVLLGIIIEKITNKKYRTYIEENVLNAAKMTDSGFYALNNLPENTALGYRPDYTTNIYNVPIRGGGDGGLYTTSGDLKKFWKHLFAFKIISECLLHEFITPRVKLWQIVDYGLGIYIPKVNDRSAYVIVGGDAGVGFKSKYIPADDVIMNILSNKTNGEEEIVSIIDDYLKPGDET
jgi:CubicO group peptidase (beta-lactamase class C family)